MTRIALSLASLVAIATLATGCTHAPAAATAPSASATTDCRQLSAQIASAEQARRAAREQEKEAWKAVVPFAVVARYAKGKAAAENADKQLDKLYADFKLKGCQPHGV